ncbi:hypothetical protein BJX68DRAFT_46371 [Aspergillus pseudodeflectus]|uniref:YMC020W-like alpha/beta hydrolase domain-containing protein n=1 Tax=Aspergillus pseudodeflectus TaxID=176178 RepID=A0ABR4KN84_9EURO
MASTGSRKRVKPSPPGPDSESTISSPNQRSSTQRSLWYPTSVWPSKAAPVTEVARESISMTKPSPSNFATVSTLKLDSPKQQRHPSLQLTKRAGASSRSLPADATTTCINIASDGSTSTPAVDPQPDPAPTPGETDDKEIPQDSGAVETQNSVDPQPIATGEFADSDTKPSTVGTQPPSGWFSWVYAPFTSDKAVSSEPIANSEPNQPPETGTLAVERPSEHVDSPRSPEPVPEQQDKPSLVTEVCATSQKRSWLEMWYESSSSKGPEPKDERPSNAEEQAPPASSTDAAHFNASEDNEVPMLSDIPTNRGPSTKPSAWSFWYRDSPKDATEGGGEQNAQAAQATVTEDSPSEQRPIGPENRPERKTEVINKGSVKIKAPPSGSSVPDTAVTKLADGPEAPPPAAVEATASKQLQKIIPNQVLPRFEDTFALQDRPTLLQSIGRFLHYTKDPGNQHVYRVPCTQRIKKALAIGVHGYFPAPLIRTVLGQPTGTSIRFSNMAAEAIHKYTGDHGYTCEIEKIALEGEGRIAERVDLLWKLLLNWMEEIRQADFILLACHSQGVPVGVMLVAKLIAFGCINANRVGICAMAGVNLGPFSDYRSRWISGSAGELFEFALPYSQVSKDYESALRTCIDFGVRISYIGSIDDQLVSLESSLFSPVSHPYIYRAVFVDGRVHAPSFVSHLVGFALKLRNLGVSDHGLIRELSSPLAGSLYTGDGHSRLYDDDSVYRLAIEFALETSAVSNVPLDLKRIHPPPPANPYILPFAMRGLLEEEHVRHKLYDETIELLKQFDDWKPTSKVLKDVKFRLEGIRSKL